MNRTFAVLAVALLATSLSGSAQAGWFSDDKPKSEQVQSDASKAPGANLDRDIAQAQTLRTSGDLDGAVRILAQMMLAYPDDPRVVGEYGKVLTQQGRSNDAVNFLQRATELQPDDWTLYSALGAAYDQTGDGASARVAYEHALQLKPGEPAVLNNYALSRMQAGDLDGAQRMLAQAQQAPNANPKIAHNVALLAALRGPTTPAVAVAKNTAAPVSGAIHPLTAPVQVATLPPAKTANTGVVMQKVPVDPMAGPVATKTAAKATGAPRKLAVATAKSKASSKSVKVAAKKKDATPALRMTADASAP